MGGLFQNFEAGETVLSQWKKGGVEDEASTTALSATDDQDNPATERVWVAPNDQGARGRDARGDGTFGARRRRNDGTEYVHEGTDFIVKPNQAVKAVTGGYISKLGYPYKDNSDYRYVEITTDDGYKVRQMYVSPRADLKIHSAVSAGEPIGTSQTLQPLYPGITDHVHVEIRKNDILVDPRSLIR
jgi:murein DD-endopeptidase MepM/ murein hydrolase activator NlpD